MLYPAELMVRIFVCDGIISYFLSNCKAFAQKCAIHPFFFVPLFSTVEVVYKPLSRRLFFTYGNLFVFGTPGRSSPTRKRRKNITKDLTSRNGKFHRTPSFVMFLFIVYQKNAMCQVFLNIPPPLLNNSLSGWGLGGAQPIAVAKASLALASPVYLQANDFIWLFLCKSF